MRHQLRRWQKLWVASTVGASFGLAAFPSGAIAHVKWFADYDVAAAPRDLFYVCSSAFWLLVGVSLLGVWTLCKLERTIVGAALLRALDSISLALRSRTEDLMRASTAAFFIGIGVLGNVILTPELKTDSSAISWLQFAIAFGMFWRGTLVFSALGIVVLYAIGIANYGVFHMMDYPIFLGAAGYLALTGLQPAHLSFRPLDVAKWAAAITLLWASVEKWAYPEWTFPLLQVHPRLTMGLDASFYMTAAGLAEFGLAFGLLWTPLVRRLSALVLAAMFISAVFEFGKVDAIGHLLIVAILLAVAADDQPAVERKTYLAPALYCAALLIAVAAYYGAHTLLFGAGAA